MTSVIGYSVLEIHRIKTDCLPGSSTISVPRLERNLCCASSKRQYGGLSTQSRVKMAPQGFPSLIPNKMSKIELKPTRNGGKGKPSAIHLKTWQLRKDTDFGAKHRRAIQLDS